MKQRRNNRRVTRAIPQGVKGYTGRYLAEKRWRTGKKITRDARGRKLILRCESLSAFFDANLLTGEGGKERNRGKR